MAYRSLAEFLEVLAADGQLARVPAEVDSGLEIAEITRRVADQGGPALLFERVQGKRVAVVTNLLGTPQRACRVLGLDRLEDLAPRMQSLVEQHTPQNWFDRLRMSGDETGAGKFRAKAAKSGSCQQIVHLGRDIDLASWPLLTAWPGETMASITAGLVVTGLPEVEAVGVTAATLAAVDGNHLAVVDDGPSAFTHHWQSYRARREKLPLAVILGGDPALLVAAQLSLPPEVDGYQALGLARGAALEVVKCRTHDLLVPADADVVLEGYVDPDAEAVLVNTPAPGGSHFRVPVAAPVVTLTAITQRSHPIWPATIDAAAGERRVLASVREQAVLAAARSRLSEVADLHLVAWGGPERFAVASFAKQQPFQGRQIAAALWGLPAVGRAKFLILVDAGVNVRDLSQVWAAVGAHVAPERDLLTFDAPASPTDHANTLGLVARHVALDATTKLPGETAVVSPAPLVASPEVRALVERRWTEYRLP